ncbi:HAD family hydrolase [Candidatus Omnitrophota bacterium]
MDLIIFDADGTLFDTVYFYVETYHQLYKQLDLFIPRSKIHRHIGMGADKAIRRLCPPEWLIRHGHDILSQGREYYIRHFLSSVEIFPKTNEFITKLKEDGKKIALATMSSGEVVKKYLELLDDGIQFDFVTTSCDVKHSKPDPDIFLSVMEEFPDIPKEKICVIGDSNWDIIAAQNAGIASIGVLSGGYPRGELNEAGALFVKEDIAELYDNYCSLGDTLFLKRM